MTVRADEFALLQLFDDQPQTAPAHETSDRTDLRISGKMIPMHQRCWEDLTAIGARNAILERVHPGPGLRVARALALPARRSAMLSEVPPVVRVPAVAAVRELTGTRVVERALFLPQAASGAATERAFRNDPLRRRPVGGRGDEFGHQGQPLVA